MSGNRNERQYIEPDDHRRGYSVRPAYHPDTTTHEERRNAVWALVAIMIVGCIFGIVIGVTQ